MGTRVSLEEVEKDIRTFSIKQTEEHLEKITEKFELIDSIGDIKENISNYGEVISELEVLPLDEVKIKVTYVKAKIVRVKYLGEKYGMEIAEKLLEHQYFLGMTEEQLIDCKGQPTKIETEVMKTKTKVIYIYGNKSSGDVFNFVNGVLERFTDR